MNISLSIRVRAIMACAVLAGCKTPVPPLSFLDAGPDGGRVIVPDFDAGFGRDAGEIIVEFDSGDISHNHDAGRIIVVDDDGGHIVVLPDSGSEPDLCGDPGRVGGLCRRGVCSTGLECLQIPPNLTVREALMIPQARADNNENPTSFTVTTPYSENDLPINFAPGGLCSQQCNTSARIDTCGTCATCSSDIGHDAIDIPLYIFISEPDRMFANDVLGICRAHCTFDPNGPGDCPSGHTCDPATNLCVEACVLDSQCQSALVPTVDGNYATWRNPYATATCNSTTGRCDWEAPPNPHVGDACDSSEDCTADIGVCLRSGTCAELQCNNPTVAPDTRAPGICDGDRGVCVGLGVNNAAICMQGCNRSDDCLPGNSCLGLLDDDGAPTSIGGFTGYCFGLCDTVNSGTINGRPDQLSDCRTDEACDMPPEIAGIDRTGTCRPTCNPTGPNTCGGGQTCVPVSGRSYGFCRTLDSFCANDGATDCYAGRICDNAIGSAPLGRCVVPCTSSAQCGRNVCVTTAGHRLRGLCAEPCSGATCGAGRVCQFNAGTSSGYCVED